MIHEDLYNYVISVVHGTSTYSAATSRYRVSNRDILEVEIKLKSLREERYTTLVESHNQYHISRWVRSHLYIPLVQRQVNNDWELREACE